MPLPPDAHRHHRDLAKAYAGRMSCLRVNTDQNQEVAMRYGIRSIPTILIFRDGERKETVISAIMSTALAATVDRFLSSPPPAALPGWPARDAVSTSCSSGLLAGRSHADGRGCAACRAVTPRLAVPHLALQLGRARQVVPHRRWSAGCIPSSMTSRRIACGITVTKGRRSSDFFGQFRSFQMSGSLELKTLAALCLLFVDRVVTPGLSKLAGAVSEVCLGSKMILRWLYRNSVASSGRSSSLEW